MHQFVTEMCTLVHISVTKWYIVGYWTGDLLDLWNRAMISKCTTISVLAIQMGCSGSPRMRGYRDDRHLQAPYLPMSCIDSTKVRGYQDDSHLQAPYHPMSCIDSTKGKGYQDISHLQVPNLEVHCTGWEGTRIIVPVMATMATGPILIPFLFAAGEVNVVPILDPTIFEGYKAFAEMKDGELSAYVYQSESIWVRSILVWKSCCYIGVIYAAWFLLILSRPDDTFIYQNTKPSLVEMIASVPHHYLNQLLSHPSLGRLYVFSSFPPPQWLLLLTSKPFELNSDIWDKESIGLVKCTGWPLCDLDPRSQLWHWWTKICLSAV